MAPSRTPPSPPWRGGPHSPLRVWGLPAQRLPPEDEADGTGQEEQEEAGAQHRPGQRHVLQRSLQGEAWQETAQRAGGHGTTTLPACTRDPSPAPVPPTSAAGTDRRPSAGGHYRHFPPARIPSAGSRGASSQGGSGNASYYCTPEKPGGKRVVKVYNEFNETDAHAQTGISLAATGRVGTRLRALSSTLAI